MTGCPLVLIGNFSFFCFSFLSYLYPDIPSLLSPFSYFNSQIFQKGEDGLQFLQDGLVF